MSALIFDIETVGENFDELDAITQESLTGWIKKEAASDEEYRRSLEDIKDGLGFSPLTGQIVAIGILDSDQNRGAVYFQAPGGSSEEFEDEGIKFKPMAERDLLQSFWQAASQYQEFVSFNGRAFDVPFLMIRSAVHRIQPSKDLMSNRYLTSQKFGATHIDLLDQLTFYGAVRRRGTLHLWSRAFDIKSPKAGGITGDDVGRLFRENKFSDIARYNVGDLRATRDLYQRWLNYVRF